MPKNTSGGKKHKKGKTAIGNDENRSLLEAVLDNVMLL